MYRDTRMTLVSLTLFAYSSLGCATAGAGAGRAPRSGDVVRVSGAELSERDVSHLVDVRTSLLSTRPVLQGTVVALNARAIRIRPDDAPESVNVPRSIIDDMQVRHDSNYSALGAGLGVLAGALAGGAAGSRLSDPGDGDLGLAALGGVLGGVMMGAAIGGAIGWAIGSGIEYEEWREVDVRDVNLGGGSRAESTGNADWLRP